MLVHCMKVVLKFVVVLENLWESLYFIDTLNMSKFHMLLHIIKPQFKASLELSFSVLDFIENN